MLDEKRGQVAREAQPVTVQLVNPDGASTHAGAPHGHGVAVFARKLYDKGIRVPVRLNIMHKAHFSVKSLARGNLLIQNFPRLLEALIVVGHAHEARKHCLV
jgi:hypothetical protein